MRKYLPKVKFKSASSDYLDWYFPVFSTIAVNLTLLYSRGGGYPIFLSFEFLKNGVNNQIQIWHAYRTSKTPSNQHLNEDINAELDIDICKNLF